MARGFMRVKQMILSVFNSYANISRKMLHPPFTISTYILERQGFALSFPVGSWSPTVLSTDD